MPKKFRPYRPFSVEDESEAIGKPKRRYIPKPEKLRQDALNSREGGRICCEYCHHYFGAYYVHLVLAVWPQEAKFACKDCRESRHLRKV